MSFQIVRLELNETGEVIARRALQPLFDLRCDAMALAECATFTARLPLAPP